MRNLHDVILEMLAIIPEDRKYLRDKLNAYLQSSDIVEEDWNNVGDLLFQEVFSDYRPEEEWMMRLDILWTGDEDPFDLRYSNF